MNNPIERKYLPTLADLVDRLSIVLQKQIFIPEHRDAYRAEIQLILHDIDVILGDKKITSKEVHAICTLQLANRWIWENESAIRNGVSDESANQQLTRLKGTHAVNGVRNTAKNIISELDGGRHDYKIDCFAADMIEHAGHWGVFE